ncbi:MAG: hypothetical protein WCQ20_11765 [Synechococcaceae cyanobacterium ELA739]|jgi:hypothetical protein
MMSNSWRRWLGRQPVASDQINRATPGPPLPYSWILTNQLAIGPMPVSPLHWQQLDQAGLRGRFSCCYPQEDRSPPLPQGWLNAQVSLPDHRQQERLQQERLVQALSTAEQMLDTGAPLYVHCLAGIERSPLVAIGLTARRRGINLYEALDWVRRCHPAALPIYDHLELLEQVLKG